MDDPICIENMKANGLYDFEYLYCVSFKEAIEVTMVLYVILNSNIGAFIIIVILFDETSN